MAGIHALDGVAELTATGDAMAALKELWYRRNRRDIYLGDLFNAFIAQGNRVQGIPCGETYIDVGTLSGYHRAQDFLRSQNELELAPERRTENEAVLLNEEQ